MAAQLNYKYETPKALPGMKADISVDVVVSRSNEAADGVMKYGLAVATGTAVGTGVAMVGSSTTADKIEGVVVCHANTEQDMSGNVVVKKGSTLSVMTFGKIWGRLAADVTPVPGATAYVATTGTDAGCFTNEAGLDIGAVFGNFYDVEDGIGVVILTGAKPAASATE